jgi:hypothetical protein
MTKTNSSDPLKDEQTARFRTILKGDEDEEPARPPEPSRSILDRFPRAAKPASTPPRPGPSAAKRPPEAGAGLKSRKERYRYAFWDVTSWLGLLIDIVMIAVIIILLIYVRRLNIQMKELMSLSSMPLETVSGLYTNFERMNNAHIQTTIPFNTEIPVQFDLQINQQTDVVLSQDVRINGAVVTLVAGGTLLSNTPANIILPAGTRLPITLSLTVPVNKNVPVTLQVPVDINLAQTDLGASFTGLMDVLEPLYCLLDPNAVDGNKISICEKAKTP